MAFVVEKVVATVEVKVLVLVLCLVETSLRQVATCDRLRR